MADRGKQTLNVRQGETLRIGEVTVTIFRGESHAVVVHVEAPRDVRVSRDYGMKSAALQAIASELL